MNNNKNQAPVIKMDVTNRQPATNIPNRELNATNHYNGNQNKQVIHEIFNQVIKRHSFDNNGGGYAGL